LAKSAGRIADRDGRVPELARRGRRDASAELIAISCMP
jgi:hypothetical protein